MTPPVGCCTFLTLESTTTEPGFICSTIDRDTSIGAVRPGTEAVVIRASAAATRRRVYDMLAAEKMPVQAYHHPFPGLGRVEKDGNGYRVVPAV